MLGAVAEWLPSSVAGIEVDPRTTGGQELLFWPQVPRTLTAASIVQYASATQGTKRGDASIAWEFLNPLFSSITRNSDAVKVHIRVLVPPSSIARLILPKMRDISAIIKYAKNIPDLEVPKAFVERECAARRKSGQGFNYNWEYDRAKQEWSNIHRPKAIGTPCKSFLFSSHLSAFHWSLPESIPLERHKDTELSLYPGLYDLVIDKWKLTNDGTNKTDSELYCSDSSTFLWDIDDATHII